MGKRLYSRVRESSAILIHMNQRNTYEPKRIPLLIGSAPQLNSFEMLRYPLERSFCVNRPSVSSCYANLLIQRKDQEYSSPRTIACYRTQNTHNFCNKQLQTDYAEYRTFSKAPFLSSLLPSSLHWYFRI